MACRRSPEETGRKFLPSGSVYSHCWQIAEERLSPRSRIRSTMKKRLLHLAPPPIAYFFIFVAEFGGVAIHIWTTLIGYHDGGTAGAIATFLLPFLSEAYWFWQAWRRYGLLGSWYSVSIAILVAAWLCQVGLVFVLAYFRPDRESPEHGWIVCNNCRTAFSEGVFCPECGSEG
jgi:hypothetical protein